MCVHFIGFKTSCEFQAARRIWGDPDFVHRRWDVRAQQEVVDGDFAVFANGVEKNAPAHPSFDDSVHF